MRGVKKVSEIKIRQHENAMTLTVPASFGISPNQAYQPELKSDGTIVYHPVDKGSKNIFDTDYDLGTAMKLMRISDNEQLVGKEKVW